MTLLTVSAQEAVKEDLRVVKSYRNYEISNGVTEGKLKLSIKNFGDLFEGSIITEINFSEIARQPVKLKKGKTLKLDLPLPKDFKSTDLITVWAKGKGSPILYNDAKGTKQTLSGTVGYENVDSNNVVMGDTLCYYIDVSNKGDVKCRTFAKMFLIDDKGEITHALTVPMEIDPGKTLNNRCRFWVTRPLMEDRHAHLRARLYYENADYDEVDCNKVVFRK
jgi:hypothetical protein